MLLKLNVKGISVYAPNILLWVLDLMRYNNDSILSHFWWKLAAVKPSLLPLNIISTSFIVGNNYFNRLYHLWSSFNILEGLLKNKLMFENWSWSILDKLSFSNFSIKINSYYTKSISIYWVTSIIREPYKILSSIIYISF